MCTIYSEALAVTTGARGGALTSIRDRETGLEYLWQGDPAYWRGRAPNLFPFVGRLYGKTYTLEGKVYPMNIHGFLPKALLTLEEQGEDRCCWLLTDSPETWAVYPYAFAFRIRYRLEGRRLEIVFRVENRGETPLYCGMGGHPGFRVPLEEGLRFEDYDLTFPQPSSPRLVHFNEQILDTGERTPFPLADGKRIPLRHSLFPVDALVLADAPRSVTLSAPGGRHGVTVSYPKMPYVGFWHKPGTEAPYVCIEPWTVLPGRQETIEELTQMPDMTIVPPGECFENPWEIVCR